MEDDSLNDAILLGLFCHIDQTAIRVSTVLIDISRHPALGILDRIDVILVICLIKQLDAATRNSNNDNAYLDFGIGLFDHRAAKIIRWAKFCVIAMRKRRLCRGPFALGSPLVTGRIIGRPKNPEPLIDSPILAFDIALAFHIGLTKR